MIRFFSVLCCCFCLMGYTQAQTSKKELDKLGGQIAVQMCDCFNSTRDSSQFAQDKELLKILSTIEKKGDEKAESYIASLSAEKQVKLYTAMMAIEEMQTRDFDNCLESKVNNNVAVYVSKGGSQDEMINMIIKQLKKKKKCQLFRSFLVLSLKPKTK